jgi:hypothetical protein
MAKVVADPDDRIIYFTVAPVNGLVTVDVAVDVYSQLKKDWAVSGSLQKLKFPLRPVGGDAISQTETVGKYVFVANDLGWKLMPYDQSHELTLIGNMFAEDTDAPLWLSRPGRTININSQRSSLATVQKVETSKHWQIKV